MRHYRVVTSLFVSVLALAGLYVLAETVETNLVKVENAETKAPPDLDPHLPFRGPSLNPSEDELISVNNGAVASDVPVCSDMGADILRRGGNAVDAAITVALCIGSVNAFSSGIGGGGFMLVRDPNGEGKFLNFREMAPQMAHKHMFDDDPMKAQIGGLAAAIPGELAGLEEAYRMYGSGVFTWGELFDPVVRLNRQGFETSIALQYAVLFANDSFLSHPNEWQPYIKPGNKLVTEGDIIYRHNYARTLEMVANNGSSAIFYDPEGPIAPHIANAAQARGGVLTAEDFTKFEVEVKDPVQGQFMGREVLTTGNPSSGPALIFGLHVMDGFEEASSLSDFDPLDTHRIVETMKFMGSQRSCLGDNATNEQQINTILSREWADEVRKNISDNTTHPWTYYNPLYEHNNDHGTAHFSVLDKDGMAVSMTTTVNLNFGAQVADPITGVVLNSEMDDFSLPNTSNWFDLSPSIYNYIEPFKRPLSSMVPTVLSNKQTNRPEMVIGAAGGSRITTAVMQAIIRRIRYDVPMLETIAYPRIHHQLLPDVLYLEDMVAKLTREELSDRGHNITIIEPKTAMNGIYQNPHTGVIHAVSDHWRKQGRAAGY
ncbi:hypothetical protein TRICI_000684 [Trichomonascus ciferrii]|uniref:Glutathione hydrolase n=1 Tax=Trichomonascus ciferrii TaxID=44093 RepID=A0A642VAL7_9ASCO|nr:hypothetical protein TRICI_000684 [Trichomonascus ciferrii]